MKKLFALILFVGLVGCDNIPNNRILFDKQGCAYLVQRAKGTVGNLFYVKRLVATDQSTCKTLPQQ